MCSEISEGNTLRSEEEEEGEEDDDTVTQCYTPASEQHVRFRDWFLLRVSRLNRNTGIKPAECVTSAVTAVRRLTRILIVYWGHYHSVPVCGAGRSGDRSHGVWQPYLTHDIWNPHQRSSVLLWRNSKWGWRSSEERFTSIRESQDSFMQRSSCSDWKYSWTKETTKPHSRNSTSC